MNLKTGIDVIDIEIKSLELLKKNLSKSFNDAVELLYKTKGKIIVYCFITVWAFHLFNL